MSAPKKSHELVACQPSSRPKVLTVASGPCRTPASSGVSRCKEAQKPNGKDNWQVIPFAKQYMYILKINENHSFIDENQSFIDDCPFVYHMIYMIL